MADRKSPTKLPKVAVFIVSDGLTPYLTQTLKAVRDSSYPLESLTIIDTSLKNSEHSISPDALQAYSPCRFLKIPKANYARALQLARAKFPEAVDYLWVLPDSSAPTLTTLQNLVQYCYNYPDTVVAGPKVFSWNDPQSLIEVGIRATRYGERLESLDELEIDQGQYDSRRQVLAVSAAGMLVQAKVWDQLRGFNPELSPYNDGLEFCRRVWLAGYQVAVVPKARIYSAQSTEIGDKSPIGNAQSSASGAIQREKNSEDAYLNKTQHLPELAPVKYPFKVSKLGLHSPLPAQIASFDYCGYDPEDPDAPQPHQPVHRYDPVPVVPVSASAVPSYPYSAREKLQSQYFLRAIYQPLGLPIPWAIGQLVFAAVLAVFRILMGRTQLAVNHLSAAFSIFTNLRSILKSRKQVRLSRKVSMTVLKPLEASRLDLLEQRRLKAKIAQDRDNAILKLEAAALAQLYTIRRRCGITAGFLAVSGLVIAIMMGYPYRFGMRDGYWATLPENWADLWQLISAGWIPGGMGTPGVPDPLLAVLTLFSSPLAVFGLNVIFLIKLLFLLSPALILLAAWVASALVSRHHLVRLAVSLAWLVNPAFIFSYYSGNLSASICCICLPLALFGIFQYYGIGANYQLRGVRKLVYYQPVLGRKIAAGIAIFSLTALLATTPWMVCVICVLLLGLAIYRSILFGVKAPLKIIGQWLKGMVLLAPAMALLLPSFLASYVQGKTVFYAYLWQSPAYRGQAGFIGLMKTVLPNTVYGWGVICVLAIFLVLAIFGSLSLVNWPRQLPGVVMVAFGAITWGWAISTPVGAGNDTVIYAWPAAAVALLWLGLIVVAATFLHTLERQRIYFRLWPIFRGLLAVATLIAISSLLTLGLQETTAITAKTGFRAGNSPAPSGFSIISQGTQRSRLIVLDHDPKKSVYEVKLWRLPGASLTDSNTVTRVQKISDSNSSPFSDQLQRIPALLLAGDSEAAVKTALSLGADEILLMENADSDRKITATLNISPQIFKVSSNGEYTIYRLDSSKMPQIFSPVRASWQAGNRKAPLAAGFIKVEQSVKATDNPGRIVLHEAFNHRWQATLAGKTLKPINVEGQQGFAWPAGKSGYLQISYQNGYWWIWPYLMLVLFGLSLITLIPWSQKKVV